MIKRIITGIVITLPLLQAGICHAEKGARATCWSEAQAAYRIPQNVLAAIAKQESGFNAHAINRNSNGTEDIGLMQINTSHLVRLQKYGISRSDLLDPCTNLMVGAWILANNAARLGWNWDAIGAYNVGCRKLSTTECAKRRNSYAWKIHGALRRVTLGGSERIQLAANAGRTKVHSNATRQTSEDASKSLNPGIQNVLVVSAGQVGGSAHD